MPGTINGWTVTYTTVGGIILWSGITGTTLTTTFQDLLKGQKPTQNQEMINTTATTAVPTATPGSGNPNPVPAVNLGAATASAATNQAIARLEAAPYGWSTGTQWNNLVALWNQESGWNNNAQNPTSTAYGIAQFLDSTWAPYGSKTSNASLQIQYGLEYIRDRYGSPSAAWAHEIQYGWY